MSARPSTEEQLFIWKNWDELSTHDFAFSDITLTTKIGEHEAGTQFPLAYAIHSNSLLILEDEKGVQTGYDLRLTVGEKVDLSSLEHKECQEGCCEDH